MTFRVAVISLLILSWSKAYSDEYRSKANEGYDYYKNGEYDKAAEYYRQAGILKPDKALPRVGKGASLYKSSDFQGAEKEFESAASLGDAKEAADMQYNIGNSRYRAQDYKGAIESYIEALKANPGDLDFKHNLELALSRLQRQQQQQQNQGDDKNEDKNKQDQNQGNDQDKNDQQQQQKQDKQTEQNKAQQGDQTQNQQQASAREGQMNKEEAENLLARFKEDEKEIQKQLKQVRVRGGSKYDW